MLATHAGTIRHYAVLTCVPCHAVLHAMPCRDQPALCEGFWACDRVTGAAALRLELMGVGGCCEVMGPLCCALLLSRCCRLPPLQSESQVSSLGGGPCAFSLKSPTAPSPTPPTTASRRAAAPLSGRPKGPVPSLPLPAAHAAGGAECHRRLWCAVLCILCCCPCWARWACCRCCAGW